MESRDTRGATGTYVQGRALGLSQEVHRGYLHTRCRISRSSGYLAVVVPDIVAAILGHNLPGHATRSTWRLTRRLDGRSSGSGSNTVGMPSSRSPRFGFEMLTRRTGWGR